MNALDQLFLGPFCVNCLKCLMKLCIMFMNPLFTLLQLAKYRFEPLLLKPVNVTHVTCKLVIKYGMNSKGLFVQVMVPVKDPLAMRHVDTEVRMH